MGVQVIKSVAVPSADQLSSTIEDVRTIEPHVDAILVDSHWRGGTGEPCDITIIHKICNHLNGRIVVAGGIGETNILKYMSSLRPYAFDVESSVEWQFVVNGRRVTAKSVQKITSLLSLLRSQTTLTF